MPAPPKCLPLPTPSNGFEDSWFAADDLLCIPEQRNSTPPVVTIVCSDVRASFRVPSDYGALHTTSAKIAAHFGIHGGFILRCPEGCVTPLTVGMQASEYRLELPFGCPALGLTPSGTQRQPPLAFAMRPPTAPAEWLAIKLSADGQQVTAATAHHVFSPAPAVVLTQATFAGNGGAALSRGQWQLWSPDWQDVSNFLHTGQPIIGVDCHGRPQVHWPAMGITELSAGMRQGVGGEGWFHLSFSLPSDEDGHQQWDPLVMCDGDDTSGVASKIIIRHSNSAKVGQWAQRGVGPYASHTECQKCGSHAGANGILCRQLAGL